MRKITRIAVLLALIVPFIGKTQTEKVDLAMMQKIRKEGLENSKVMDIAFHLTDVSGPRLTNSPGYLKAANWAKDEFHVIKKQKQKTICLTILIRIKLNNQFIFITI